MTDRVFPASKPASAAANGGGSAPAKAPATINGNGTANGLGNQKAQVYNPANRPVYRPQSYNRHHRRSRPSCRRVCCCCCFWSILILLILALMATISATALYVIYHPRSPSFSVPLFRISRFNLTTSADSSVSNLSSLFNFTLVTDNPNQHLTFSYDPFTVEVFAAKSGVLLGNGTIPEFFSDHGNKTQFRSVIAESTEARDMFPDEANDLKSDLKRPRVGIWIAMTTKVKLQMGKLKSKGVEIIVSCEGFQGTIPKGKTPTIATSSESKCKVDLKVKVWQWSL